MQVFIARFGVKIEAGPLFNAAVSSPILFLRIVPDRIVPDPAQVLTMLVNHGKLTRLQDVSYYALTVDSARVRPPARGLLNDTSRFRTD